ncbi:MAG TPA: rhomboid family intramembrane serine protease [Gemmata sp.]
MPIRVNLEVPAPAAPRPPVPLEPTAALVLKRIAATDGPWFPARFAAESGAPRDSLDDPLTELRVAGLILATEWVRGVGQGYALTPAGRATVADASAVERLEQGTPVAEVAVIARAAQGAPGAADPGAEAPEGPELAFRPPVVVPALLMANAIWFFICAVWGIRWGLTLVRSLSEGHPEILHRFGAVRGLDLLAGEWWRLFTCCFVHVGALHLLGNMFALAMMGPLAELLWGRGRLLLIYVFSGLAGSALAMAIRPDALLAGASGAIWGVQMSLFVWLFTFRSKLPTDVAADWFRRLTVVFLLNAAVSFLPNVSWEGHLGGGLAGLLTAALLNVARFGDRPRRLGAGLLLVLLPVLCVMGLAGAMGAKGMPGWQRIHKYLADRAAHEHALRTAAEKEERLSAAWVEYNAAVGVLAPPGLQLTKVGGALVNLLPDEREAVLLLRDPERTPQQTAAVRIKLQKRKQVTGEVAARMGGDPVGVGVLDERRARAHRLAVARGASLELLLRMIDTPGVPAVPAWDEWEKERLRADRLGEELKRK